MELNKLTEEQKSRLHACETPEQLIQTAADIGMDLSDDEMAMISGGAEPFRQVKDNLFGILMSPADNMMHLMSPADGAPVADAEPAESCDTIV